MSVRNIIDKKQVLANVKRARGAQVAGADFLLKRLAADLDDRLGAHTRSFENGLLVSPWSKLVFYWPKEGRRVSLA